MSVSPSFYTDTSATVAIFNFPEISESGRAAAAATIEAYDDLWLDVLEGPLYTALVRVGVVFAVGTLLFFSVQMIKDLNEGDLTRPITSLIWPVLIVFLLTKPGDASMYRLATYSYDLRQLINEINQTVLTTTHIGVKLDDAYRQAQGMSAVRPTIEGWIKQCESLTGKQQMQCMQIALKDAQELLTAYGQQNGSSNWLTREQARISEMLTHVLNWNSDWNDVVRSVFWTVTGPAWEAAVYSLLLAFQFAFQNLLEFALLLTILLGPLAVGGSLLPVGGKPIYAWLTAIFSLFIAKLCFNITAGLASTIMVDVEQVDHLWFAVFIGVLSPIFSTALAAGGGMAVWSSITNMAVAAIGVAATSVVVPKVFK
jgi:hypothetical protein